MGTLNIYQSMDVGMFCIRRPTLLSTISRIKLLLAVSSQYTHDFISSFSGSVMSCPNTFTELMSIRYQYEIAVHG